MRFPCDKLRWRPLTIALLVALAIHGQLLLTNVLPSLYEYWRSLIPRPISTEPTEVSLLSLSQQEWERNLQLRPEVRVKEEAEQEPLKPQSPPPEPEPQKDLKGQVVDVAPTPDNRPPEDARFLSEHNTRVERESISRHRQSDYSVAQSRPKLADTSVRRADQPPEEPGQELVALVTRKRGEAQTNPSPQPLAVELPDLQKHEALKLKLDLSMGTLSTYEASDAISGNSDRFKLQLGEPGQPTEAAAEAGEGGEHEQTVAMFRKPSLEQLDMVSGAPANDHVEDVAEGEETLLNSREFKYATFFNRVKRIVSQRWSPRVGEEYMRRDPYGNIYGVRDRYTVLDVALQPDGEVDRLGVARSSGLSFFDDVALGAFREAAPFPNPPQGLVESDGRIHFQFGFYFEIGERPRMRAFRFDQGTPY